MKTLNKRIGVARVVTWEILTNGTEKSLEGRDLSLFIKTPRSGYHKVDFEVVDEHFVRFVFDAKIQSRFGIGTYDVMLVENKGKRAQSVTDSCGFVTLVDCTCKETVTGSVTDDSDGRLIIDASNIEVSTIDIPEPEPEVPDADNEENNVDNNTDQES